MPQKYLPAKPSFSWHLLADNERQSEGILSVYLEREKSQEMRILKNKILQESSI